MSDVGVEKKKKEGLRKIVSPADVQVASEVIRDKAALLLCFVDHVSLIHHVPVAKGDQSFEMVGEQLPADVDPEEVEKKSISLDSTRRKDEEVDDAKLTS